MSTSDDYQVPVRDGRAALPEQTAPEEMYWLQHMDREELSEKFVSLRDNFYTLKKFSCRQEDKIKKLQTKLRKLIADRKKDGKGSTSLSVKEIEYQDALDSLQQTIRELRLKNEHLEKKLKLANIQLNSAKKNKPMLFRHVGARVDSGLKQSRPSPSTTRRPLSPPKPPPSSNESSGLSSDTSMQPREQLMPERIREILEEARERILALESEREDLQEQLTEKQQTIENAEYEAQQRIAMLEEEVASLKEEVHHQGVREERNSVAAVRAERESRTLSARSVALQEQLVATEEKVAAEKKRKDAVHSELERMTEKLLEVENQLRGQLEEQQRTAGRLQEVTEKNKVLEIENNQLKTENENLTTLNLNFEQRGLAAENESLKAQIAHLESALQSDLSERESFLEHLTRDKESLARAQDETKGLRAKLISLQEELQKANTKLSIYSKAGLDAPPKDLTFLQQEEAGPSTKDFEKLKEAHSELQLLYRERSRELERLSNTITAHSLTYQSLQAQVAKVTQESEEKESNLSMTIRSLKDTIRRREERCKKLEAQVLTITDKSIKEKLEELGPHLTQTVGLGKHDNVLEFHIDRVVFEPPEFSHLKTFISWTVPFSLEDPLQHTNVAIGAEAHYNYSALYKFQVNHKNLDSLQEDIVTVSVYILLDSGHPAKVGECGLTFSEVLNHPRNTLHGTVPVLLTRDDAEETQHLTSLTHITPGQVIGNMSYWFRLQRPCEDAITQHLHASRALSTGQKENLALKGSKRIKSTNNPLTMKNITNKADEKFLREPEPSAGVKREDDDVGTEVPVLSPSSQTHPPLSPSKNNDVSSESGEGSVKLQQNTMEISESKSKAQDNTAVDNKSLQEAHVRSESVSSTGTYNVESPRKTKTKDISKKRGTVKTKVASPESSSASHSSIYTSKSKSSSLLASKKSTQTRPGPQTHDGTVPMEGPQAGPSTSRSPQLTHQQSHTSLSDVKSPPCMSSEDSSDTLFEDSGDSEVASTAHHNTPSHGGKGSIANKMKDAANNKKKGNLKKTRMSDKSPKQSTAENLSAKDENITKDNGSYQDYGDPKSSSESCSTSDSEGVVTTKDEQSRIYVEVSSLTLWPDCGVLQDPMVELIFVDYHGFLGLPPDQLETPLSLPKHAPDHTLNFNFCQEFSMDERQHPARVQALTDLMAGRGILKFTVTSEPPEELQDTHDCQDLGYAYVDLHQLAREGRDLQEEALVVESAEDGSQMGVLRVTLHIVQALEHLNLA